MLQTSPHAVETKSSWIVAGVALVILATAFGAPWIVAVALKMIAAEVGGARSVPALASALAWFGAGLGGILMGRIAERVGVRWTVLCGTVMIAAGLAIASLGPVWPLYAGCGIFIGVLGIGGINAPLYVYVSNWFDRRRGSALALISSGTYIAGAFWPPLFERVIAMIGWRQTMLCFALLEMIVIAPLALYFLVRAPAAAPTAPAGAGAMSTRRVLGWPPNLVFAALMAAIFLCCVPMSMPQGHLIALCSDLGINASHGAWILSLLLGTAFLSRQFWGVVSDRIGGLRTVLIGSLWQAAGMAAFLVTQDEVGLIIVAAAFGLGFSGLIPATVLAGRELFPAAEAAWRIPILLLCSGTGMATGGWLAGVLYDAYGYYGPAFAAGIVSNLFNAAIIATLVIRRRRMIAMAV